MRILILTSKTAEPIIREVVGRSVAVRQGRVEAVILPLPIPVIGFLDATTLLHILEREGVPGPVDVVLVPGTVTGDVGVIGDALGVPAFKASRDPGLLPRIIDYLAEGGDLSTRWPAEDYLRVEPEVPTGWTVAYELEGLRVAERGPPVVLAAEIPPGAGDPQGLVREYAREGAELVVVGMDDPMGDPRGLVGMAVEESGVPVVCEAPSPRVARACVEAGGVGVSISASGVERYYEVLGPDPFYLVGDRDVEALARAYSFLSARGARRIALDPVVGLPLIDFGETYPRYKAVSGLGVPLWFSAANAANVVEADSHGVYSLLAAYAVELGASFFLVVVDSYKMRHSVAEAREALRLATNAWARRAPPQGIASRLLVVKQATPPPPPTIDASEAVIVDSPVEPILEDSYFRVEVDHGAGRIVVEHVSPRGRRVYTGSRARYLARVIARETGIGAEHAAYLGEELYKAELALRTGRTYIQDSEVFRMVWED